MVSLLLLPADVALIIEVAEEDDEGHAVAEDHGVHGVWEVAVGEQVVAGVQEEEQELQLQGCMGTAQICRESACIRIVRRSGGSPVAGRSGIASTTGTSACGGRWPPSRSRST